MRSVYQVMRNTVELFGQLPCQDGLDIPSLAAYAGESVSAYENYALADLSSGVGARETAEVAEIFFGGRPHIWPIFPGRGDGMADLLAEHGLVRDDDFFDMSADVRDVEQAASRRGVDVGAASVLESRRAHEWADAVWYGFDSGCAAPMTFARFACEASALDGVTLAAAEAGGEVAATGMLVVRDGMAGIFYISTRPEHRGHALASAVVALLAREAARVGCDDVALLATPSGRPLYESLGFSSAGVVPIYRFGDA